VPELLTKLERRGYRVTNHLQQAQSAANTALSPAMSEYLWLALRVYQKLGTLVEQEIRVPGAALDEVAAQLPASSLDGLESESEQLMERLRQAVDGKAASPPLVRQDDTVAVRAALRAAYDQRGTLTIEYFSPARGEKTIRTIEPTMLYAREGVEYVEAWCRLADDARTFRVDRIVRVVDHQCPVCHKCAILPP
jgi:predicted DNA-binding transcriptional regulator YafY